MLTAIQLLDIMKETGKKLSELASEMTVYPQLLENVSVQNKEEVLQDEEVVRAIEKATEELGESGRVLVRPSGTEPLIRVMVEAETEEICQQYVQDIVEVVKRATT